MAGLESDTIGGYNSMLKKQRETAGEVLVSTVLFDDRSEVLYDRIPLRKMPRMTEEDYYVRGCTALLDAVGGAIHHIGNVHKYARKEDRPDKTVFVIITDGMENASRRYSYEKVRGLIERQKEKYGWEFLFLGANIYAVAVASRVGISADRAVEYNCDDIGVELNYRTVSEAVSSMRTAGSIQADWAAPIARDRKSRKQKR
jgi:hypothetical protein